MVEPWIDPKIKYTEKINSNVNQSYFDNALTSLYFEYPIIFNKISFGSKSKKLGE